MKSCGSGSGPAWGRAPWLRRARRPGRRRAPGRV